MMGINCDIPFLMMLKFIGDGSGGRGYENFKDYLGSTSAGPGIRVRGYGCEGFANFLKSKSAGAAGVLG